MRLIYFGFGTLGFALDYIAHLLQALSAHIEAPALATLKLVVGWNDTFFAGGLWVAFSIGVIAHTMFLFAFVLLALRGK